LPSKKHGLQWTKILDTSENQVGEVNVVHGYQEVIKVEGRSVVLLHSVTNK
jgi:hypothetical protein